MSLQKRKCHKGFQHAGRSIEALCLEPYCTEDRLLCFYCIHESHPNHSIAYLIPGLKSPLEMLNKNSHSQHPQKNMKYIQKRFKKINNGWLKISDNLENGISRIQERMVPQFNVIRQTFKKNSVQHIIKELTSSEITAQKIQEYVEMINMVKRYKFNDVKKLKFMTFMIEHKLSRIFLNANNKIKEIMNRVIEETNEMNFLNFNLQELLKDRALYLQITKNLTLCRITDLQINSQNIKSFNEKDKIPLPQIQYHQQNHIIQQQNQLNQSQKDLINHASFIIVENSQIEEQQNEAVEQIQQNQQQQRSQNKEIIQGQNILIEQVSNNYIIQEQHQSDQQVQRIEINLCSQSQSQNHSNGFRSYKKSTQQKKNKQGEVSEQKSIMDDKKEQRKIQYEQQEGEIWQNQQDKKDEKSIQNNKDSNQSIQQMNNYNDNKDMQQKNINQIEINMKDFQYQQQQYHLSHHNQYNQQQNYKINNQNQHINQLQQKQSIQNHQHISNQHISNQHISNQHIQNNLIQQHQHLNQQSQNSFNHQQYNQIDNHQSIHQSINENQHQSSHNHLQFSPFKQLSQFSCQFPSINQNSNQPDINSNQSENQCQIDTSDQLFIPSYQFSLSITSNQMTLVNTFNLKQNPSISHISSETANQPQTIEFFNENNQFDDFLGFKKQNQDQQKAKQYQILKKYFIFYNSQNSDQSSQQLGPVPPKRVKWIQQNKKGRNKDIQQQSQQKHSKKKVKPLQLQPTVQLMNYPRTRSQKQKMMKLQLLQNTTKSDNKQKGNSKKNNDIKNKDYEQNEDSINQQEQQINNNDKINQHMIIQQVQQQEQSSQSKLHSQIKQAQSNQDLSEEKDQIYLQNQNNSNSEESEEQDKQNNKSIVNNTFLNKKEETNIGLKKNKLTDKSQIKPQNSAILTNEAHINHHQSFSITSSYPPSLKLDKQALDQVSHSLLNKYEKAFINEQNNHKKQTDAQGKQNKIKINAVHINGRFHEEIKKRLSLLDEQYVEQLTIYCDTMDCAINQDSVGLICKMIKLTKLCVYWTYKLPKTLTKKLISSLPLLEQLVLCQLQDLDTDIANEIVTKLPNLRRFHYASDYMRNLDKMEQNLQFLIDFVGTSTKLAPLFILAKLKNIETFWISDIDDVKQVRQILSKMKTLKQVSISAFQKRNKDLNSIFNVLSKKTTLISLSLQGLQFKEQNLVSIIRNNQHINTLIINECPTVTNNTLAAVADTCQNLEQLFLMLTDSLEGQRIFQLKKLRTLVVRACWSINSNRFREGIKKLKNLRYLSLNMNNYWLGDDMLPSISSLPSLVFLNLDTTKVTDKGMQFLVGLKNLNTLICGRTQITANGLYKFLEKTKSQIKKLGLSRQSSQELNRPQKINKHDVIYTQFEGNYLVKIGQLLPELTHLSIGGFKNLYIENFATLDNLKCLQYKLQSLPQETQKFLQTTRLNLNANY